MSSAHIGFQPEAVGSVTISGNDSRWSTGERGFYLGYEGSGNLLIEQGGILSSTRFSGPYGPPAYLGHSAGSTGVATVTGSGSRWSDGYELRIGYGGSGELRVDTGGEVISRSGYLGEMVGATGEVVVTGTGSTWSMSGDLFVGRQGSGTLTVADGGLVEAGTLWASLSNLHGDGAIASRGAVLDNDLVFDGPGGSQASAGFGAGGTLTVTAAGGGSLGAGYKSTGSLTVANGAAVASTDGYLGYYPGAVGTAVVTGAGSEWSSTGALYVGHEGSGDLTVADGGSVATGVLWGSLANLHGDGSISASKGAVLDADLTFDSSGGTQAVTGFGVGGTLTVTADNGELGAGYKGAGSLTIADGVVISSLSGYLGHGGAATGTATVTGSGTEWNLLRDLFVGEHGGGTLTVDGDALVASDNAYLGHYSGGSGAVVVNGAESRLAIGSDLIVGDEGAGSLTVADGGHVTADVLWASASDLHGNGAITATSGAVIDGMLMFDSPAAPALMSFGSGGTLSVTVTDGPLGVGYKGTGELTITDDAVVTSDVGHLGYLPGSSGAATVTGGGAQWNSGANLYVGQEGSGALNVESGARVQSVNAYLGYGAGATGTALVTGPESEFATSSSLEIGWEGDGAVTVAPGGLVSTKFATIGRHAGAVGEVTIVGSGAAWTTSAALTIGHEGSGAMLVEGGANLSTADAYIGREAGGSGAVTIAGPAASWTSSKSLYVGQGGSGTLMIANGANVSGGGAYLGQDSGAMGAATVTGVGSQWSPSSLRVGGAGNGSLTVTDGGSVTTNSLWASMSDLHGNGTITATGGAVLDADLRFDAANSTTVSLSFGSGGTLSVTANGGPLGAGYMGEGSLTVADGVFVQSGGVQLGFRPGSNGVAMVTGRKSSWKISGDLYVGKEGSGSLRVESGGNILSYHPTYLGYAPGSDGSVRLTGVDSEWKSYEMLYIGYEGHGSLEMEAGAQLTSWMETRIGDQFGAVGSAIVAGPGTEWTSWGPQYVGFKGAGTLTIEDGATVEADDATLGYASYATGAATVTGTGSEWSVSTSLDVGVFGHGMLTVTDGGIVTCRSIYLGYGGKGRLRIADGGLVSVEDLLTVDYNNHGDSYINMSTGGMLALFGDADDSLSQFYDLISGSDAINYWDADLDAWAPLTGAAYGEDYTLEYLPDGELAGYTLLTVGTYTPGLAGDFNNDGVVDAADYTVWRDGLGTAYTTDDYDTWAANYGATSAPPANDQPTVPEPSAALLCALAAARLLIRRRGMRGV